MAEMNPSLLVESRHHHYPLDPKSLILSQKPQLLKLATESPVVERGPRFKEYSELRERKLRARSLAEHQTPEKEEAASVLTPHKKQVKFSSDFTTPPRRPKAPSFLAQSVPDFSSALRKENRKPPPPPPVAERWTTPPAGLCKNGRVYGKVGGGSKSTNSAEKRRITARKSYANMEELKRLAVAAGKEINGGKIARASCIKTFVSSRLF